MNCPKTRAMPGHKSTQLIMDTYGRWLTPGNKTAADRLDEPSGSKR